MAGLDLVMQASVTLEQYFAKTKCFEKYGALVEHCAQLIAQVWADGSEELHGPMQKSQRSGKVPKACGSILT